MIKKLTANIIIICSFVGLLTSCSVNEPQASKNATSLPLIYPDYTNIEMPYNIAPLNFQIQGEGDKHIVKLENENGETLLIQKSKQNKFIFREKKWKQMLNENKGKKIKYTLYSQKGGEWIQYPSFENTVSEEAIDPYLTYRLIEPSYMSTGIIGLYEHNMETSEQKNIITNHRSKQDAKNRDQCCVNCHYSQRFHPENKMFYYRGPTGGMILTYNGKIHKINTKPKGLPGGTVYGCWHPDLPFIAFSSNVIRQSFPNKGSEKVHAYDYFSDLVLYDVEKNELTDIFKTKGKQETFPHWSPDGKTLYFCSSDTTLKDVNNVPCMKYDLKKISFDPTTKSFGEVETIYEVAKDHMSAMHPRISFDNKFLLFTVSDFGPNAYTQKNADLYLMDLRNDSTRNLKEVNSPESDCYHSWSSNSNWFVFVCRIEDGNYGRPFFSHIDSTGKASKPFALPHKDPEYDLLLLKSYNAPELSASPVEFAQNEFEALIFDQETVNATYHTEIPDTMIDSYTGASKLLK